MHAPGHQDREENNRRSPSPTHARQAAIVRCRQCRHSSDFSRTTPDCCYCAALRRRVCACDRYGRHCDKYELRVKK